MNAARAPKRIAARYYQLKAEHALIGPYLKRIKKRDNDRCWWCKGGLRQTRVHLFKECRKWKEAQNDLWGGMEAERDEDDNPDGLHRNPSIPTLFAHPKATKYIMQFLRDTEVGRRIDEKRREAEREERSELWGWNWIRPETGKRRGKGGVRVEKTRAMRQKGIGGWLRRPNGLSGASAGFHDFTNVFFM